MSHICIRRTKEVSSFAIIVGFVLTILQMHDSNGVPILALPPVSNLYVLREYMSKQ
jgi:hypothetical protein